MDAKQRIEIAKVNLKKAESAQTVADTEKKAAEREQADLDGKLKELGVTPETAPTEITTLESTINEKLTKVEGLIPVVGA